MLEEYLAELETELAENGMPAKCMQEYAFTLPVRHGEWKNKIAITKQAADSIKADIGDTVTIETADDEKEFIITAFYQTMNSQGVEIRNLRLFSFFQTKSKDEHVLNVNYKISKQTLMLKYSFGGRFTRRQQCPI